MFQTCFCLFGLLSLHLQAEKFYDTRIQDKEIEQYFEYLPLY